MNNVLVTGASGFIGQQLVKYLLQQHTNVRVLIRNDQKSFFFDKKVEVFVGDLAIPSNLSKVCEHIDTVFHLGGYAHAWHEMNSLHDSVNFQGTRNILKEAINSYVKQFVFFSSVKAVADSTKCIDEKWEELPHSFYGIAKRKSEQLVLTAKSSGMHVCVLRPSLVYGPGWKGNLAAMLNAIDRGLFPPLPKINNVRSMVSINDICHAAMLAATNPQANGQIYFVTDSVHYSTDQLYILMRQALGKSIPRWHVPFWLFKLLALFGDIGKKWIGKQMPFDSERMSKLFDSAHYSSSKIQKELGFYPTYNLEKMLPDIIKQYRSQKGNILKYEY